MHTSLGELIVHAASKFSDKVALVYEGQRYTFRELDDRSSRIADALLQFGIERGHVVSLYSPNSPEWIIAYYAILKIGGVVNPLNLMLTPTEAAYALADCGAVAVFASADRLKGLDLQLPECKQILKINLDGTYLEGALPFVDLLELDAGFKKYPVEGILQTDLSTIAYTSGTTGHPKGAMLSHRSILTNTAMTATMHLRTSNDVVVSALPLSHVYGNIVMNSAIAYGLTLVLHRTFEVEAILESIEKERATIFEGVPTMYSYLLSFPNLLNYDTTSLTRCTVGGQTMPVAHMERIEEAFGCRLLELWGMTELGGLGTTHSAYGKKRLGSVGLPLPEVQVRTVDPYTGTTTEPGAIGQLQVKGPITMEGYLGSENATQETLDSEGWLSTGDLARIESDGDIYIVDRLKDMIITAGFNIYPAELERIIAEHPKVAMVAVGSIDDPTKGELAKAYIVPCHGEDIELSEIEKYCRSKLAAYKVPRYFQLVSDLPKTSSGKVVRRSLESYCNK